MAYSIDSYISSSQHAMIYKCLDTLAPNEKLALKHYINKRKFNNTFEKNPKLINTTQDVKGLCKIIDILDNESINGRYRSHSVDGIILEYIPGKTLYDCLEELTDYNEIVNIFQQILYIMSEFHKAGFMHRDLKPENIMITPDKKVKIIDFEYTTDEVKCTNTIGTPLFMAPEVLKGQEYTNKCDVYSVGMILFNMMEKDDALYSLYPEIKSNVESIAILKKGFSDNIYDICYDRLWYNNIKLLKLFESCIQIDPEKRCTMEEAYQMSLECKIKDQRF
jgi:serine/threonine protein kinase